MKNFFVTTFCAILSFSLANAATITPQKPVTDKDSDCLKISSAEELYGFAEFIAESEENRSACAILTDDITVNKDVFDTEGKLTSKTSDLVSWTPILNYKGVFDGQGHTISGLYIDDNKNERVGFFGSLILGSAENPTIVKNVGITNSYFKGSHYVGSIVANVRTDAYVTLDGVFSNSTVIGDTCGGIAGYSKKSTLTLSNSYFTGDAQGKKLVAGLVGYAAQSITISNSYTIGSVTSETTKSSLVAYIANDTKTTIQNTYFLDTFEEKGAEKSAKGGIKATKGEFANGTVALKLREYKDESVWGQDVKKEASPTLRGEIKNATVSSLILTTYNDDKTVYPTKYIEGIETTLPSASRDRYTFEGWYKNDKFEGDAIKKISKNSKGKQTYYAKFKGISSSSSAKSSSSSKKVSSSSAKSSSSSKKVSSSSAKSSSSSKKVSSSSAKSSSSSKKVSSSSAKSSSSKAMSSSSKKSIADIKIVNVKPTTPDTLNGCYQIGTVEELYGFAAIVNGSDKMKKNASACGELTSSIVVNKNILDKHDDLNTDRIEISPWTPIMGFKGSFNGHGYKISGLYLNKSGRDSVGLFGVVTGGTEKEPVVIENIGLVDSYFDCGSAVGGIVGAVVDAHLKLSHVYNQSTIKGYNNVGGLVGAGVIETKVDTLAKYSMAISNAFNSGSIVASFTCGGLIGIVGESVSIINAYNYGTFKGTEHSDILIGYNYVGINVSLLNTYFPDIFNSRYGGDPMDPDDFENGVLLKQLKKFNRKGVDGSAWDNVIGTDLPGFPAPDDKEISDAIIIAKTIQKMNVTIQGRNMVITGLSTNTKIIVTDIQGHLISKGSINSNASTITLPHNGVYLVRAGNELKTITIK